MLSTHRPLLELKRTLFVFRMPLRLDDTITLVYDVRAERELANWNNNAARINSAVAR